MIFFFLDPPFADDYFIKNLEYLKFKKIFNKNHIIIIHRKKSQDDFENLIKLIVVKNTEDQKLYLVYLSK